MVILMNFVSVPTMTELADVVPQFAKSIRQSER